MSMEQVVGATYGPYRVGIAKEKVSEYAAATGDLADRWENHAPPGYAAALLFVAAPHFLEDPRVSPFTGVLVHVDQSFTWHRPIPVGEQVSVIGKVERVRERGGSFFVTFTAEVDDGAGERLLDATATFLMGEGDAPSPGDDGGEPAVWKRELNETPSVRPRPAVGETVSLAKSASRIDLVKYAAASGDYNPIHYDHEAARSAGLPGIVVHGLLMAAWGLQVATMMTPRPDPIAHVKFRFRSALRPGLAAEATATRADEAADGGDCQVAIQIVSGDTKLVTATGVVRLEE